jgi:hypothetical protein
MGYNKYANKSQRALDKQGSVKQRERQRLKRESEKEVVEEHYLLTILKKRARAFSNTKKQN